MLKKTGLWNNIAESLIEAQELQPDMFDYQNALNELQKQLTTKGEGKQLDVSLLFFTDSNKSKKVSGFEHKRKRKWIPGLKEKREAEKLAKRGIWKKKEKKDY